MTAADNTCEVCEAEPMAGVAAVPGAPISVAYGRNCMKNSAVPLWIADFTIAQCIPFDDLDFKHVAAWFREQTVPLDGGYKRIDELTLVVVDCDMCKGTGLDEENGVRVEYEDGTRVERACVNCYRGKVVSTQEAVDARP